MPFTVTCTCGKKLSAREEHVGKRAKCPQCGQMFLIAPKSTKAATEPATAGAAPSVSPSDEVPKLAPWFDLLASDDPSQRKKGADHLVTVGPEAVHELPLLVERSTSENMLVRHWAVACIGLIGPAAKESVAALMDRLGDDQPLVRDKAAKAIEQVMPEAKPFVPTLLRALAEKDDDRRAAAIELFRRNLKTIGISRFRFWACTCGRVYIKVDLEQRLRTMVDAPEEVSWEGKRNCGQCGARYEDRDIYAGKYDVPEPHWSRLRTKFGPQLSIPDDFLADAREEAGYRISDDAASRQLDVNLPSLAPFSISLESPASEGDEGYAIAAAPSPPVYGVLGKETELVPGVEVPKSGKYKCTSCSKKRLKPAGETGAGPTPPRASIVMQFKAGKTFTECPNCRDLTEWEWLG